jgi:hypothetical protein
MAEAEKKDATAEAAKDSPADAAATPKPRAAWFLPYLIGGAISAALGVTAGIVTTPHPVEPTHEAPKPEAPVSPFDAFGTPQEVPLKTQILSLGDPGQSVNGRFTIRLEVRLKPGARIEELLAACNDPEPKSGRCFAKIKDALGTLFSGKVSTDVKTARGKEILKLEIIDRLAPIVFPDPREGAITNVFFEEFLVQ